MNYVKEKLETVSTHKLDFYQLFDFISSIEPIHDAQNSQLQKFVQKWNSVHQLVTSRLWICHIRGCWKPRSCSYGEILRQVPWTLFSKSFSSNFSSSAVNNHNNCSQPLNFEELLKLAMWEDLYTIFGSSVVSFIFNKCILVVPVEENLHLFISHSDSLLCRKIVNASKYPRRRRRVAPAPRLGETSESNNLAILSQKVAFWQQSCPVQDNPVHRNPIVPRNTADIDNPVHSNPYAPSDAAEIALTKPQTPRESRKQRKLKRKLMLDKDAYISKKIRVAESSSKTNGVVPISVRSKIRVNTSGPSSTNPRWIIPSTAILKQIQSDREAQRSNISSTSIQISSNDEFKPTFLSIMDDKYFTGKLDVITKECYSIKCGAPLPTRLNGLKIPNIYMKPTGEELKFIVHRISVTCAKNYRLRIKPKKRSRKIAENFEKGKQGQSIFSQISNESASSQLSSQQLVSDLSDLFVADTVATNGLQEPCSSEEALLQGEITGEAVPSNNSQGTDTSQTSNVLKNWSPFSSHLTLSTAEITYNKRFDNKAPASSELGRLMTALKHADVSAGGRGLEYFVLKTKVHVRPISADRTNPTVEADVEAAKKANLLFPMRRLMGKMAIFHKSVSNITKLVRSCASHWILKEHQKFTEKAVRKRSKQEQLAMANPNNQLPANCSGSEESSAELIDLTMDTPSTGLSEDFSVLSVQHKILANGASGGESRKETLESFRRRQQQASLVFNISATVLAESQAQFKLRKQQILSNKLKEKVSFSCLLSTLSQILHLSGASELLGSNYNRRGFFKFIRKSICLGGTQSALQLGQLMSLLDFNHCSYLNRIKDPTMKCHIFTKIVVWLFREYVLVILKIGFYVTETSRSRFQLEFYFRDTWRSLSDRVRHRFIKGGKLIKISSRITEKEEHSIPVTGTLRLIPKANDLRPILALRSATISLEQAGNIKLLLNYISVKVAPNGIRDATDLQNHWKKLITEWKELNCPKLYYVRADIREAYPSVNIELLRTIIKDAIVGEEELVVKQFLPIGATRPMVKPSLTSSSSSGTNWHTSVASRPCIIVDSCEDTKFELDYYVRLLLGTLKSPVVKIGKHKYDFSHGLPQGSPLSHSLCNIYYGHMDKTHFSEFMKAKCEMFIRSVDDYLYISPSPHRVAEVFHKLRRGFATYHCGINREKSLTNLYVPSNLSVSSTEWFGFCGWRFCITNGHVVRDFSSYANQDICSTLTFRLNNCVAPEEFIYKRVGMITPLRLKPLLLDPAINCRERILITLFEASLMMAFRLYAACRVVYPNLNSLKVPAKGFQLFRAISRFATVLKRHVMRSVIFLYPFKRCYSCKNEQTCKLTSNSTTIVGEVLDPSSIPKPHDPICNNELFFLVYHAFYIKLSKHHAVFQETVLPKLFRLRAKIEKGFSTPHFEYLMTTLGSSMPKHFEDFKI